MDTDVAERELLYRCLEAIRAHREFSRLDRKNKNIPLDHEIWLKLGKAQLVYAELLELFGEKE